MLGDESEYEVRERKKVTLASAVRAFCECADLTRTEIATLAGVSRETIIGIEEGKVCPTHQELSRIAEALGYGVEVFLDEYYDEKAKEAI